MRPRGHVNRLTFHGRGGERTGVRIDTPNDKRASRETCDILYGRMWTTRRKESRGRAATFSTAIGSLLSIYGNNGTSGSPRDSHFSDTIDFICSSFFFLPLPSPQNFALPSRGGRPGRKGASGTFELHDVVSRVTSSAWNHGEARRHASLSFPFSPPPSLPDEFRLHGHRERHVSLEKRIHERRICIFIAIYST